MQTDTERRSGTKKLAIIGAAVAMATLTACAMPGMAEACRFSNTQHCLVYRDYMSQNPGTTEAEYREWVTTAINTEEYKTRMGDLQQRQYELYDDCVAARRSAPGACYNMYLRQHP